MENPGKNTKDFLLRNIENSRRQMRATGFIRLTKDSLRLFGKTAELFIAATNLKGKAKKPFEIVLIEEGNKIERQTGDMVTEASVFLDSNNVVWEEDAINFIAPGGSIVSSYQYDYIVKEGLEPKQFFARSGSGDREPSLTWKLITRKAQEARKDKAKDIFYLTVGSLEWLPRDMRQAKKLVSSPLMFCLIREDSNSRDIPRFRVVGDSFKINAILGREIKDIFGVDVFQGCPNEIPFDKVDECLKTIKENVLGIYTQVRFLGDDINLCLLDSSNETICQAVENNIDKLANSSIIQVLAEEKEYDLKPLMEDLGIYPLLADDSQREVIWQALSGNSVHVAAAAGTGKSQTMVNIAANMVIKGKTVCVMSEKAAANEVFAKYAGKIGLEYFCLEIDNKMSVEEIIGQLKNIVAIGELYVDSELAREVLESKKEIEREFANYNLSLYGNIPELNICLYTLIGEALGYDSCQKTDSLYANRKEYMQAKTSLQHFQQHCLKTISIKEYENYLSSETTEDEEVDFLIQEGIDKLSPLGIDILKFIKDNNIEKEHVAKAAISNLARIIAEEVIAETGMRGYGNRKLKAMYGTLTDIYSKMSSLYTAFMVQELSKRVSKVVKNNKFVEKLDRLKTSKITLTDLFRQYGQEIMKLCPIIVTTPSTAANYITADMNVFDVLMIDEASQVPITSVLQFLVDDRQLIVFGDHMQLDITSYFTKTDHDGYDDDDNFDLSLTDKSILHSVQGKIPSCQLRYHYRSKTEHLLKVSNMKCYDNMLNVVPDVYTERKNLPNWLGYEVVRIDKPEMDPKGCNLSEAKAIANRVVQIKQENKNKSIGIITFNDKQQGVIIDELENKRDLGYLDCNLDDDNDIWTRSLENAQGKEADIIIISIAHYALNKDGTITKRISDINRAGGNNRLNVLFTRAREKNIIYISFDYKELKESNNESMQRLYQYLDYAKGGDIQEEKGGARSLVDKLNENLFSVFTQLPDEYKVVAKVGQNDLMVDVAIASMDGTRYKMGVLLSNMALSPNTICTKINVLEKSGWNVMPASPIYLLERKELFIKQTIEALASQTRLGATSYEVFLSTANQARPVTDFEIYNIEEKAGEELEEKEPQEELTQKTRQQGGSQGGTGSPPPQQGLTQENLALTLEELLEIDFVSIYSNVFKKEMIDGHKGDLKHNEGDREGLKALQTIITNLPSLIKRGVISKIIMKVNLLYVNNEEKLAGYLLAQLLRTQENLDGNKEIILALLEEAKGLGIA